MLAVLQPQLRGSKAQIHAETFFLMVGGGEGLSSRNEEKASGLVGCFHIEIELLEEQRF